MFISTFFSASKIAGVGLEHLSSVDKSFSQYTGSNVLSLCVWRWPLSYLDSNTFCVCVCLCACGPCLRVSGGVSDLSVSGWRPAHFHPFTAWCQDAGCSLCDNKTELALSCTIKFATVVSKKTSHCLVPSGFYSHSVNTAPHSFCLQEKGNPFALLGWRSCFE